MSKQITLLEKEKRFGTAKNYQKTYNSFNNFLNGKDVLLSQLNECLVNEYSLYLEDRGLSRNSISFYMRNLRAVYNKAVKKNLVKQKNPFASVYTGIDKTEKRAVDEDVIVKLYHLELSEMPILEMVRDLFVFSFCARGMSYVDVAYLKKKDIRNGYIVYRRSKTKQLMTVKVEKIMNRIIEKYQTDDNEYVFSIIKSTDERAAYKQYLSSLDRYNRNLKKLMLMIGNDKNLTSYTVRHSWATVARKHKINISIISAGMGHSNEMTTNIYLKELNHNLIDVANRKVIDCLNQ